MSEGIKKGFTWIRDGWMMFGIALLLLVILEALLSARYRKEDAVDRRYQADAYAGAEWAQPYFEEFVQSVSARWEPYVYWRRNAFQAEYNHVNEQGIRRTWNDERRYSSEEASRRIFLFGGSTMWGSGARDDYTIPSLIAKALAEEGIQAEVTNFGESGYVSTQGMMLLVRQIQQGNFPDLVIFYDGVNDVYSAYQQQVAGIPQNEQNRVMEFNMSKKPASVEAWIRQLSVLRFLGNRVRTSPPRNTEEDRVKIPSSGEAQLAEEVVAHYQANLEVVQSLAERHAFETLFYWQPTVFDKTIRTDYEAQQLRKRAGIQGLYYAVNQQIAQRNFEEDVESRFTDMSGLFFRETRPLFIDWCHVEETGNALIAARITRDILIILGKGSK